MKKTGHEHRIKVDLPDEEAATIIIDAGGSRIIDIDTRSTIESYVTGVMGFQRGGKAFLNSIIERAQTLIQAIDFAEKEAGIDRTEIKASDGKEIKAGVVAVSRQGLLDLLEAYGEDIPCCMCHAEEYCTNTNQTTDNACSEIVLSHLQDLRHITK